MFLTRIFYPVPLDGKRSNFSSVHDFLKMLLNLTFAERVQGTAGQFSTSINQNFSVVEIAVIGTIEMLGVAHSVLLIRLTSSWRVLFLLKYKDLSHSFANSYYCCLVILDTEFNIFLSWHEIVTLVTQCTTKQITPGRKRLNVKTWPFQKSTYRL